MNYDIAHCDAQYYIFNKYLEYEERHCSLRNKCKRHKAYMDLYSDEAYAYMDLNGDETSPIAFIDALECIRNKHKLYCEDKE